MSLKDGFQRPAKKQVKVKNKVKCGKVICKQTVETKIKEKSAEEENVRRKSLRRISKVLSSRILDTSKTLVVRRKIKSAINSVSQKKNIPETSKSRKSPKKSAAIAEPPTTEKPKTELDKSKKKRCVMKSGQINIKNFFPISKNPKKINHNSENNEVLKKTKLDTVGNFVKTLSLRKAKVKTQKQNDDTKTKPKVSLKRKLQSTIQTTVKKVKSISQKKQTDFFRAEEGVTENKEDFDKMPLLEKIPETPEKCERPTDLPVLTPAILNFENNQPPPSLTKEITPTDCGLNEEVLPCRIINDPPKIIPCTKQKNKFKKPNRGLNDCIAMLTNKLQQKVTVNENFYKPVFSFPNIYVPEIIPTNNFDGCYEVLDLSKKVTEIHEVVPTEAEIKSNEPLSWEPIKKQQPRRNSSRKIGQKREKQSNHVTKEIVEVSETVQDDTEVFKEEIENPLVDLNKNLNELPAENESPEQEEKLNKEDAPCETIVIGEDVIKIPEIEIQPVDDKEEEAIVLENKSIVTTVIPTGSDSEDEIPLSELRQNLHNKNTEDELEVKEFESQQITVETGESEAIPTKELVENAGDVITDAEIGSVVETKEVIIIESSSESSDKKVEIIDPCPEIETVQAEIDKKTEHSPVRVLRSRANSGKDSEPIENVVVRKTRKQTKTEKENEIEKKSPQPENQLQDSTNLSVEKKRKNGVKHDNPFEYLDAWNSDAQSSEWLFKSALKAQEQNNMLVPSLLAEPNEPIKPQTKSKVKAKRKKKSVSNDSNIENKEFFCDICSKSFMRNDSLTKHYKTLIHIAKLSEIEAQQAAENKMAEKSPKRDEINLCNMLQESEKYVDSNKITSDVPLISSTFALNSTNSNTLKLADIINDVLNKPVEENSNKNTNFSNIILQSTDTKVKRCKSLGERKSFESDHVKSSNMMDFSDNFGSSTLDNNIFAKTTSCADSLLEKQITLLENMIENRSSLNYIDDISVSSENNSARNSPSELSSIGDSKDTKTDLNKDSNNFIKPVQYEEISEDSGNYANNFEEQKSRKTLNRDEELFLECCSLLKSGSEVSSYSKSSKIKSFHLKPAYEPDWPEHKSFSVQCQMNESSHFMSDTSRIPTPLGDNFADDACSSNTVSFDLKNKTESNEEKVGDIMMFEDISEDKSLQERPMMAEKNNFNFSFQFTEADEPSKGQEADVEEEEIVKNGKFAGMVDTIKSKFHALRRKNKRR